MDGNNHGNTFPILKVEDVSKMYRLGQIGGTTLRDELRRIKARIQKKDDPTRKIGATNYNRGDTFLAIDHVSFSVAAGERIGIIGHNGAGKSTLLKLISRITAPTNGAIYLNGRVASMLEVGTGFHHELTGRENIYLNGAILGMTKKEIDQKLDEIIDFSECRDFIDTPVKRYSSGMYVKLAFSVAAHLNSEILIMDEVLAVGDMAFQNKCITKMSDISRQDGRTILYVSHNMSTIRQLCDRCIVLNHGKLIFDGDVEDAISFYYGKAMESSIYYDYSKTVRQSHRSMKLEMRSLQILKKQMAVFRPGESIELKLQLKANEDIENAKLRFEVFANSSVVGSSFLDQSISCERFSEPQLAFTFSTERFVPGKYIVVAVLYEDDEHGHEVVIDRVEPALIFEMESDSITELLWKPNYWGYIRLDAMKLISNQTGK